MAAGEFVRLNTLGLFNSILFFLFCPLGLALIPHRQMKRSVLKLLICYVIYLLYKCFSFFSTSQQAIHHRFFCCCCWETKKCYVLQSVKNLFFNCTEEERACGEKGKRRISPTANSLDLSEPIWETKGLKSPSRGTIQLGCLLPFPRWLLSPPIPWLF